MFLGIRKKYWWLLGTTLLLVGLMIFLQMSPVFAVKVAAVQGPFAEKLDEVADDCRKSAENLFRIDRKVLAERMLARSQVENVRLWLDLPNGIRGEINSFEPAALIMTDRLYGLDRYCRMIPYDTVWKEIDLPLFTGLTVGRLFLTPDDYRVAEVMAGLREIKERVPGLYRQIAEIDFSDPVYISIFLTTGTDRFLAGSRDFTSQLIKLDMVNRAVARSDEACYNLIYDGVVIKQR